MSAFVQRKNRIVLSDYPYQRDLECRLLLSSLTEKELALLNELFHSALEVPLADLCHSLDLSATTIVTMLHKFTPSKLCQIKEKFVILDKEMRRYFETEVAKFDKNFEPGMEYLQERLSRVPPYVLPNWYALPRHCEKIFPAIIEKFFVSPKIYQRYLKELVFPDPILNKIVETVFTAPNYKVKTSTLKKDLSLTPEQLHEYLLLLEFHLACVLSYECSGGSWEEIVSPYYEWQQYLLFHQNTIPTPISDVDAIKRFHPRDFGFCEDLNRLLQLLKSHSLPLKKYKTGWTLTASERLRLFPHHTSPSYAFSLVEKALFMHFAEIQDGSLFFLPKAEEWMSLDISEKALCMTRHPIQVEKGLERVLHQGWIYVEDFLKGFTGVLRGKEPLVLSQQGKRWKYAIPSYNQEELILIETTLYQRLFEAGIVATGTFRGKPCFCVTPFGLSLFE